MLTRDYDVMGGGGGGVAWQFNNFLENVESDVSYLNNVCDSHRHIVEAHRHIVEDTLTQKYM